MGGHMQFSKSMKESLKRIVEQRDQAARRLQGLGPAYRGTPIYKALTDQVEYYNKIIKRLDGKTDGKV